MAGYVFLSNSTKPTPKEQASRDEVKLTNVSRPCLKAALGMGFDVFFGTNRQNPEELQCELPVKMYDSHTYRSITAFGDNKIAYDNLKRIVEENPIEVIHCNTPVGGMIGRFIGKRYHINKVIYTVHGLHFYKNAPLFNRTVLKWAEMLMARWTDVIITINEEDFQAAQRFKLKKGGKVYKVHGVGIDTLQYGISEKTRSEKRAELSLNDGDFVIISVGDLNENKNNEVIISAMEKLQKDNIHYILCGVGDKQDELQRQADIAGLHDNVHFLGYRKDVKDLYQAADCFVMPSFREGLSRSIMEAMASGLPCVVSKIRGNVDLVDEGKGGFLLTPTDADGFASAIEKLYGSQALQNEMRGYNLEKIKEFDSSVVEEEIKNIYRNTLQTR